MKRRSGWRTLKTSMAGSMKKDFSNKWIRTDYRFESPEVAGEAAGFFFGDEMKERILRERMTILPECTGVWWLKI